MKNFTFKKTFYTLFSITVLSFLFQQSPSPAFAQTVPVQLYQSNPPNYSWTVQPTYFSEVRSQDKGKTFANNKNPFGFEVYECPQAVTNAQKDVKDFCIPRASTLSNGKFWSTDASTTYGACNGLEKGFDGPAQSSDTRTLNGTAKSNANSSVCSTKVSTRATTPFLNITKQFNYTSSLCSGTNKVVLAARVDPTSSECTNLNVPDAVAHPQNYTKSQLSCLMYVDNTVDVTACKGGTCKTQNYTPGADAFNGPIATASYQNVCSAFSQGDGTYDVTLKAYDVGDVDPNNGGVMYGSSSFWLTWLNFQYYTITGSIYNDSNRNGIKDGSESNHAATPSITASSGTVVTNSDGTYTISNVLPGTVTVSYNSLPSGYTMTSPLNGPPPSFQVTVGQGCTTNGAPGASCQ
jgi:hypothetical protein